MQQDTAAHTREQVRDGGPDGAAGRPDVVDYAKVRPAEFPRAWAWAFVLSGGCALASIPAVFVFEHLGWSDEPPRFAGMLAGVIWLATVAKYQKVQRSAADGARPAPALFQTLARLGIALILGFVILCVVVAIMYATTMDDF